MSRPAQQVSELFSQVEVAASSDPMFLLSDRELALEQTKLMKTMLSQQQRQTELLQELVQHLTSQQKQRAAELGQWKQANPALSRECRAAAETLSTIQTAFIERLAEEVKDQGEGYYDGEFLFNEFVDRYGPRLAHLNGVMQVLSQLGSSVPTADTARRE